MESCSQNHFKIFCKLFIFFFSVLLTPQDCTVLLQACAHTAEGLSVGFCFCDMPWVWQTIQEVKSSSVGIAHHPLVFCVSCLCYYCCQEGLTTRDGEDAMGGEVL